MKCEHCKKDTVISFEEWRELTTMMLSFMDLTKEQQDLILLAMDGALYRQEQRARQAISQVEKILEEK
jgi:hypothetical protein